LGCLGSAPDPLGELTALPQTPMGLGEGPRERDGRRGGKLGVGQGRGGEWSKGGRGRRDLLHGFKGG